MAGLTGSKEDNPFTKDELTVDGGKGSGNFGHLGRPGKVGGSGSGYAGLNKKVKSTKTNNRVKIGPKEYAAVSSGIFTDHPKIPIGAKNQYYEYGDYFYTFDVLDWKNYRITFKLKIVGNEDFIAEYKKGLEEWQYR